MLVGWAATTCTVGHLWGTTCRIGCCSEAANAAAAGPAARLPPAAAPGRPAESGCYVLPRDINGLEMRSQNMSPIVLMAYNDMG